MSINQLYIPGKLKVGSVNRKGTYTGKLAYVIYYDQKGTLRKETSWQSWRDKEIEPLDLENVPTEGFVLNKGVGGGGRGWDSRNEYIRVYDPRDFEFEISVANLLFILKECDCSRGKGLEGEFVYSWDRKELVLLPIGSQEYQNSKNYTSLQGQKVKARELIPGASYLTKKQETLIYLGRFDHYDAGNSCYDEVVSMPNKKKHIFWNDAPHPWSKNEVVGFVPLTSMASLAKLNSDTVSSNYAELVEKYYKSVHGSKPIKLSLKKRDPDCKEWAEEKSKGIFSTKDGRYTASYTIKDDILHWTKEYHGYDRYWNNYGKEEEEEKKTDYILYVRLESGSEFKLGNYGIEGAY